MTITHWFDALRIVALSFGIFVDLTTLHFAIKRYQKKKAPSGVPVVALLCYLIFIFMTKTEILDRVFLFVLFALFHMLCQIVIPLILLKFRH